MFRNKIDVLKFPSELLDTLRYPEVFESNLVCNFIEIQINYLKIYL